MPDLMIWTLERDERALIGVPAGRTIGWRQQLGPKVEAMRATATASLFEAPRCTAGFAADVPPRHVKLALLPDPLAEGPFEKVWLFLWPDAYGMAWLPVDDAVVEAAG